MANVQPQTVFIARHATRIDQVNPEWRAMASRPFDPHLSEKGLAEAERLAQRLARERIDVVYASPFLRALQTAAPIAQATGAPLRVECGACEWLRQQWFTDVPSLFPDVAVDWHCDGYDKAYASPASLRWPEQWEDVMTRTRECILRIVSGGGNIVVIGHGASVVGMVAALADSEAPYDPPPAPPASLFKLVRDGNRWRLELESDTAHLDQPGTA